MNPNFSLPIITPQTKQKMPIFVLDNNSAFNLSRILIDEEYPFLLWLSQNCRVQISEEVYQEYRRKVSNQQLLKSVESCKKTDVESKYCIEVVKKEFKGDFIGTQRHKGEMSALSLVLYLSRRTSEQIILVTDEFKNYDKLQSIISEQCAGNVLTSFDLMIFLFTRLRDFVRHHVEYFLEELFRLFPRPEKEGEASKAETKRAETLKKLKEICRLEKCQKAVCYE